MVKPPTKKSTNIEVPKKIVFVRQLRLFVISIASLTKSSLLSEISGLPVCCDSWERKLRPSSLPSYRYAAIPGLVRNYFRIVRSHGTLLHRRGKKCIQRAHTRAVIPQLRLKGPYRRCVTADRASIRSRDKLTPARASEISSFLATRSTATAFLARCDTLSARFTPQSEGQSRRGRAMRIIITGMYIASFSNVILGLTSHPVDSFLFSPPAMLTVVSRVRFVGDCARLWFFLWVLIPWRSMVASTRHIRIYVASCISLCFYWQKDNWIPCIISLGWLWSFFSQILCNDSRWCSCAIMETREVARNVFMCPSISRISKIEFPRSLSRVLRLIVVTDKTSARRSFTTFGSSLRWHALWHGSLRVLTRYEHGNSSAYGHRFL